MQARSTLPKPVVPLTIVRPLLPAGLLLPFPHGKCFVPADHILALSGERNYTRFHFRDGGTLLYSRTLGEMLTRLPAHSFERIHRSHAVNRQYIHTISENGVELVDGSVWGVSRRKGRKKELVGGKKIRFS
ncbi:LytR/AlgR family response regulator transcription factor [Salmonirosea aquatica]